MLYHTQFVGRCDKIRVYSKEEEKKLEKDENKEI